MPDETLNKYIAFGELINTRRQIPSFVFAIVLFFLIPLFNGLDNYFPQLGYISSPLAMFCLILATFSFALTFLLSKIWVLRLFAIPFSMLGLIAIFCK